MRPQDIEKALDLRPTDEILRGLKHTAPGDVGSDWWTSRRYYQFYVGIAALVKPKVILEIGVKLGYSLIALFRGYSGIEKMVGIDSEGLIHGSQRMAIQNLRAAGYQ